MKCFAESNFYKSYGSKRTVISLSEAKVKAITWEGDHLYPKVMYQVVNIVADSNGRMPGVVTMQDCYNTKFNIVHNKIYELQIHFSRISTPLLEQ